MQVVLKASKERGIPIRVGVNAWLPGKGSTGETWRRYSVEVLRSAVSMMVLLR